MKIHPRKNSLFIKRGDFFLSTWHSTKGYPEYEKGWKQHLESLFRREIYFGYVSDHFQAFWKFDLFDLDDPISDLNDQNYRFRVENPSNYYQLKSFCSWYQKLIHKYNREITFMEIVSFWINKKIGFLLRKIHYPRIKDMFNCMDNMSESINETNLAMANILLVLVRVF